jgi:hypothetical protein
VTSIQLKEDQRGVTIGEAARQSGLPVETLRYYDREGLAAARAGADLPAVGRSAVRIARLHYHPAPGRADATHEPATVDSRVQVTHPPQKYSG